MQAKKITHLAEEMNDEFLERENEAKESVCRRMANDLRITHSMCELNTEERRQRGIKSHEEFITEELLHGDGAESSEEAKGINNRVICKRWKPPVR